jgi:nitroreductase
MAGLKLPDRFPESIQGKIKQVRILLCPEGFPCARFRERGDAFGLFGPFAFELTDFFAQFAEERFECFAVFPGKSGVFVQPGFNLIECVLDHSSRMPENPNSSSLITGYFSVRAERLFRSSCMFHNLKGEKMTVFEAIENRRAAKDFDPNHRLTAAETDRLLSAAMLSPTAFNLQHWRFVVVEDPELRKAIRAVSWDQAQVTDASLLVVVCGDLKAWEKDPARYWRNAPEAARNFLVPVIGQYYTGNEQAQRDEVMRSCGLAAQTLMLAATEMGLDSCPMDGFDFDAVGELIRLPEDHVISMFVTIGKSTSPSRPRSGPIAYEEAVIRDRF